MKARIHVRCDRPSWSSAILGGGARPSAPIWERCGLLVPVLLAVSVCAFEAAAAEAPAPLSKARLGRLEAIQLGVSRNLDVLTQRLQNRRTELAGSAAWQAYSPSLDLSVQARDRASGSPLTVGTSDPARLLDYGAGVRWKTPLGTILEGALLLDRGTTLPLPDATETPLHDGALAFSLTQPLLKDGWLPGAALPLREARYQTQLQRELFRGELQGFVVQVETAYWDLSLAEADLDIKTRSRERAKQQRDDTAENIRRGILADVEIYVVEENLVFFEAEVLRAEQNLLLARRRLAELLLLEPDSPLDAEDVLVAPAFELPERQAALEVALRGSPEVLGQRLRKDLSGAQLSHASNQALPNLDLTASVAARGVNERFGGLASTVLTDPTPDLSVGVRFAVPLDQPAVRASVRGASVEAERQEAALRSQELKVRFEVDNALSTLDVALRQLALSKRQVELAELKLKAQSEKYQNGISTLADVVRFQRDLDNALIAYQRAIRTIHVQRAELLATQGTLLEAVGVEVK